MCLYRLARERERERSDGAETIETIQCRDYTGRGTFTALYLRRPSSLFNRSPIRLLTDL